MSTSRILIDVDPGEDIADVARRACEDAKQFSGSFILRHNDTFVEVADGDTPELIEEQWRAARRPKPREMTYVHGHGPWLARHSDWSGVGVFAEEIDALRYALANGMTLVEQVPWGEVR